MKEQETSKSQQQEELRRLQQQLQDMQREEQHLKEKVESSRNELQKMQNESQTVQHKFEQVQTQFDQYHKEEQHLSSQLGSLTSSSSGQNVISELPSDLLNIPSFGESDAVSARATVSRQTTLPFMYSGHFVRSHPYAYSSCPLNGKRSGQPLLYDKSFQLKNDGS